MTVGATTGNPGTVRPFPETATNPDDRAPSVVDRGRTGSRPAGLPSPRRQATPPTSTGPSSAGTRRRHRTVSGPAMHRPHRLPARQRSVRVEQGHGAACEIHGVRVLGQGLIDEGCPRPALRWPWRTASTWWIAARAVRDTGTAASSTHRPTSRTCAGIRDQRWTDVRMQSPHRCLRPCARSRHARSPGRAPPSSRRPDGARRGRRGHRLRLTRRRADHRRGQQHRRAVDGRAPLTRPGSAPRTHVVPGREGPAGRR
jgi:hypothetical protein